MVRSRACTEVFRDGSVVETRPNKSCSVGIASGRFNEELRPCDVCWTNGYGLLTNLAIDRAIDRRIWLVEVTELQVDDGADKVESE